MPINTYLSHVIHNNKAENILGATPVQPGELGEAPTRVPAQRATRSRRGAQEAIVPNKDMKRVTASRTTGCYPGVPQSVPGTTKHTGSSRTHTRAPEPTAEDTGNATGFERKNGPTQRRRRCSTNGEL